MALALCTASPILRNGRFTASLPGSWPRCARLTSCQMLPALPKCLTQCPHAGADLNLGQVEQPSAETVRGGVELTRARHNREACDLYVRHARSSQSPACS